MICNVNKSSVNSVSSYLSFHTSTFNWALMTLHLAINQPSVVTKMCTDSSYNVITLSTIAIFKNNKEKTVITDRSIFYIQIKNEVLTW